MADARIPLLLHGHGLHVPSHEATRCPRDQQTTSRRKSSPSMTTSLKTQLRMPQKGMRLEDQATPVVKKTCRRRQVARARRQPVHTMHCSRRRTSPPDCSLEEFNGNQRKNLGRYHLERARDRETQTDRKRRLKLDRSRMPFDPSFEFWVFLKWLSSD